MPALDNPVRVGAVVTVTDPNGNNAHQGTIEFVSANGLEAIFKSGQENNAYRLKRPDENAQAWFWELGNGAVNIEEVIP